jgi:hypothetical protein
MYGANRGILGHEVLVVGKDNNSTLQLNAPSLGSGRWAELFPSQQRLS